MSDIKNTQAGYNIQTTRSSAGFINPVTSESGSSEDPQSNSASSYDQAEPKTSEYPIYPDMLKNQLVSDTGGHQVVSSYSQPSAGSAQADANYASENALLQSDLQKEAQHSAADRA